MKLLYKKKVFSKQVVITSEHKYFVYENANTVMIYGDAKATVSALVSEFNAE